MKQKRMRPDDFLRIPGLTMQRHGRFIELDTRRTPDEQAKLIASIAAARPRMRGEIEDTTKRLEQLLHKYTSFDLVGHLWLQHGLFDIETYKETEATHRPHFVEHATMLQLKDHGYQLTPELLVDPADVSMAEQLLDKIFTTTMWFYATEHTDPTRAAESKDLDQFRWRTLLREMTVGPPAYPHHWDALIAGLFGAQRVAVKLEDTLGFDLAAARKCVEGITGLMAVVLRERPAAARKQYESMKAQLTNYIKTGKFDGKPEDKLMFDNLRNMRQKERNHTIKSMAAAWITVGISDTISFTAEGLSEESGLPVTTVSHFLDTFSLHFGSTPADYAMPSPIPAIRYRPIAKIDERYFCPAPSNLPWALKEHFELALKTRPDWQSYQKHRADFLVDQAVKTIATMLPGCESLQNLMYVANSNQAELDGLILFDRYAFLVEGKAGSFAAAGRRGGPSSIARGLQDLVVDPARQAIRALEYIRQTDRPVFTTSDGTPISIDKTRTTHLCPITLTLDSLDVFTPDLQNLRTAGILQSADLPWAVCLTDLWAISELVASASEFTHFLKWRLAVYSVNSVFAGSDELNWFAIYLKEGPKFVDVPAGFDHLMYTSYTDDLDAYFYNRSGHRQTPAERPSQPIPARLRTLISSLERTQPQGFTAVTEFLLDLDFSGRRELAGLLTEVASAKNTANMVSFDAADHVVILVRGGRPQNELDDLVAKNRFAGKSTLVLAIDAANSRVIGWATGAPA